MGLNVLFERITDAFFAVDVDWKFVYVNGEAERLLGRAREKLIGKSVWEEFPEATSLAFYREYQRAMTEQVSVEFEEYYPPLAKWFEVRAYPSPNGLSVFFHDVTRRHDVEDEREHLLVREEALAKIGRALVSALDLDRVAGVVVEQSQQVLGAPMVGLWLADPIQRKLRLFVHRGIPPEGAKKLDHMSYDAPYLTAKAARTREMQTVEDVRRSSLPEKVRNRYLRAGFQSLVAVPLVSHGNLVGVVTLFSPTPRTYARSDLDFNATVGSLFAVAIENARLYGELRQALRLREEFIGAVAHELRTPVAVIMGWAQALLVNWQKLSEERKREAIGLIASQSERIRQLIDDLITVGRLRPGVPTLRRFPFDLSSIVRQVVRSAMIASPTQSFEVHTPEPLFVDADRDLLADAVRHLIQNAVQYSPKGESVEVTTRRVNGDAVVCITDHGVGIATERQPHVFEPFYELVPPGKPSYVGLVTIGLYLSKQIVEANGGQIWFSSTPGRGSTFAFSLPLARVSKAKQ